eukprot:jgi/Chlat1/1825/Chrsp138S02148
MHVAWGRSSCPAVVAMDFSYQPQQSNSSSTKVSVRERNSKEFTSLQLMQELKEDTGPVWSMKSSLHGQYLASAGQDFVGSPGSSEHLQFAEEPHHVYIGCKADVLDLCWSKTDFLLSASMDQTARSWHIFF